MHIEQLEYEVWQLRGKMNQLRASSGRMDPQIYSERLNRLDSELNYIHGELLRMKMSEAYANPLPESETARELPPAAPGSGIDTPFPPQGEAHEPTPMSGDTTPPLPFPPIRSSGRAGQKVDLEKAFGTGIMGVVASVLIFVSIIIFGSLIIPFLSREMMAVLMFIVSFALSGAGLVLLKKNRLNKFNLSLCACGVTAVCISLFVTRILFGFIGDAAFLALMAAWIAAMAYLCKKYHYIFRLIGEIGMLMAGILGTAELSRSMNVAFYAVLAAVCGCSFALCHFMNRRESYVKDGLSHAIHTVALLAFAAPFRGYQPDAPGQVFAYAVLIGLLALFLFLSWKEEIGNGILFYLLTTLQVMIVGASFSAAGGKPFSLFFLTAGVLLVYFFSRKPGEGLAFGEACASALYLFGGISTAFAFEIGAFLSLVCIVPPYLYGCFKNRKVFLYAALFGEAACTVLLISLGFLTGTRNWGAKEFLLISAIPFAIFLCVARKRESIFKAAGYLISTICFAAGTFALCGNLCEHPLSEALPFLILAVTHLVIIYGKILWDESALFEASYSIVTFLLMVAGCRILSSWSEPGLSGAVTFFMVLVLFALFSVNSARLLKKSELFGYYVAAKYTYLMLLTLEQVCSIGIVFSVCLLLFALACIIGGFRFRHKSFRIYGLILSMISVFKLILFDIEGKNRMSNAFGFLICGILCFGVSFVYNKIEHRWKESETTSERAETRERGAGSETPQ